jgi:hypothetical protein
MPRGKMRGAATAVALVGALLGVVLVASPSYASVYPLSVGGTRNCTGAGSLVLRSNVSRTEGLRASTTPVGSPVGGWTRTMDYNLSSPDAAGSFTLAVTSPNANARWSLSVVRSGSVFGLPDAEAQCTLGSISGTVIQTRSGGTKTCPSGQTVLVRSSSFKPVGHFWTKSGSSTQYHVRQPGGPALMFQTTDTGANSITGWWVRAYNDGLFSETIIVDVSVTCSAVEGIH